MNLATSSGWATVRALATFMGPPNVSRTVNQDECEQVDRQWTTPTEQERPTGTQPPPTTNPGCDGTGGECGGLTDPLILDLNGDGVRTTSLSDSVQFDLSADGYAERLAWTDPSTEEAFLWLDLHSNGRVDDGSELFGTGTVLPNGQRAQNGFEALTVYDSPQYGGNGDGIIDVADQVWGRLRLWVDRNHNGRSENDETNPIHAAGVLAIQLPGDEPLSWVEDGSGNFHVFRTTFTRRVTGSGPAHVVTREIDNVFFLTR
jgi:hypothetical protein